MVELLFGRESKSAASGNKSIGDEQVEFFEVRFGVEVISLFLRVLKVAL